VAQTCARLTVEISISAADRAGRRRVAAVAQRRQQLGALHCGCVRRHGEGLQRASQPRCVRDARMVWWQLKASIANRVCTASGDCAEFVAASAVEWGLASMETPSSLALFRHTTRITSARVHAACFARGCSALAARVRCRIIAQASGAMQCEAVRRVHLDSPITGALGPLMYSTAAQPLCPEAAAQPLHAGRRRAYATITL
jgi:hypothetical protein